MRGLVIMDKAARLAYNRGMAEASGNHPGETVVAPVSAGRGYALVLLAAVLWATLGIIYTALATAGLPPLGAAALRAGSGGLILLAGLLLLRPGWLRISRNAVIVILLYGSVGIAFFYAVYINAILMTGVAVAAVLLYTAPAWVALIAWRFLGESLTRSHGLALLLTLLGSALVAQIYQPAVLRLNVAGIALGLLSGFTYGLWSVFNKVGARYANPWALQCYGLLTGCAVLLLLQPMAPLVAALRGGVHPGWLLALALGPTIGASVAYATGVRSVPVSVASLIATVEPVVAAVLAFVVLHQRLEAGQMAGGALILLAVWLLRPRADKTLANNKETIRL